MGKLRMRQQPLNGYRKPDKEDLLMPRRYRYTVHYPIEMRERHTTNPPNKSCDTTGCEEG